MARALAGALDLVDRGIDGDVFGAEMIRVVAWVLDDAGELRDRSDRLTLLLAALCRISASMGDLVDKVSGAGGSLSLCLAALEEAGATF